MVLFWIIQMSLFIAHSIYFVFQCGSHTYVHTYMVHGQLTFMLPEFNTMHHYRTFSQRGDGNYYFCNLRPKHMAVLGRTRNDGFVCRHPLCAVLHWNNVKPIRLGWFSNETWCLTSCLPIYRLKVHFSNCSVWSWVILHGLLGHMW